MGSGDVFVHEQGLHVGPPLFIGGAEARNDGGVLGDNIVCFAWIGLEVVEFGVVHQRETRVLDGALGVF